MLKTLGKDDTVIVTRPDRIARNTSDLLNILDSNSKAGATFKSLADSSINCVPFRTRISPLAAGYDRGAIVDIFCLTPLYCSDKFEP
jgi:hypothetical protein